jgi:RHS repeat-associated protein
MNGGAVMLVYDGDGNRVAKTVGSITTKYLVDDLNPTGYAQVIEELVNGVVARTYVYGLQRISQTQSGVTSYYGYDGFGGVRALTDATGAVTDTYDYDAWGNAVNVTGSTPNVYRYRGEQYDADLNLYYLRARYFNPLTGRFLTRDSYRTCGCAGCGCGACAQYLGDLHKYLYGRANPVNRIDPSGNVEMVDYSSLLGALVLSTFAATYYEARTHALASIVEKVASGVRGRWQRTLCYAQFAIDIAECAAYEMQVPGFSFYWCYKAAVGRLKDCLEVARMWGL